MPKKSPATASSRGAAIDARGLKMVIRRTELITLIENRLEMISPAPDPVGNGRRWGAVTPFNLNWNVSIELSAMRLVLSVFHDGQSWAGRIIPDEVTGGCTHISGRCGTITTINSLLFGGWKIGRNDGAPAARRQRSLESGDQIP